MAPWPGSSGWRSRSRSRRAGCPRSSPPAPPRCARRGAAVVGRRMREGAIEPTRLPRNPLDVLAQQIVAATADRAWAVDELYALARRAENYAELGRDAFEAVPPLLARQSPSDEFAELRPRVVWDRVANTVQARRDARTVAVTSGGTIPDRGYFGVYLADDGDGATRGARGGGEGEGWRRRWSTRPVTAR